MQAKVNYNQALSLLKSGELVAVPTETVYGLAARIDNTESIEKIFDTKKRPHFDPLIVHCYDVAMAWQCVATGLPQKDQNLLNCLWKHFSPGPLTVVAPKSDKISFAITAHKKTVGLRIPAHPLMRNLIKDLQVPLAAPSANLYSKLSPTKASDVLDIFKSKVFVLDGGICDLGLESTIIHPDFKNKKIFILRPGAVTAKQLENFLKQNNFEFIVVEKKDSAQPGGQNTHYQPEVPLWIVKSKKTDLQVLEFLQNKNPQKHIKQLCFDDSPQKTARKLYSQLRDLSQNTNNLIFVIKKQNSKKEDWNAIWNRLEKASSKTTCC